MRSGDPSEIRRSLFWSKPGANPGPKPCQVRGLPGWDVLVQGDPGGVAVPGGRGRDSLWAVPSSAARLLLGAFQREEFLTAVTLPSWAAALEPGVGVCLLFHCALARLVSSSPPRSVALGSLCNPFGCSSARIQPGFRQNASPVWLGVFGWDDGMEVGSHQKEHPSDGPEEWEGRVRWRWLRMEPSHRHGGVSSGGPSQDLLGPFFYHLMVLEESWFPPGGTSPVARPCRGHQVAQEVKGSGSLQVWVKGTGSHCCDECAGLSPQQAELCPQARPASAPGQGKGMGLPGALFAAEPGAHPTSEP